MGSIADSILKNCPGTPTSFLDMHLRRMPDNYQDRYSPAEIGRHVRLLANLNEEQRVDVEVRALGGPNLEVCFGGFDRTGVLAAITMALASDGLDVQDLHLATYHPAEEGGEEAEPTFFIDVVRVAGSRRGLSTADIARSLRDRLTLAFVRLAEGDLAAAQTAASDSTWTPTNTPPPARSPHAAVAVKEGMVLDGFRLEELLATGGMSEVFLATQLSLQRKAAVKVVTGDTLRNTELSARFARETEVLARFASPHIVQVLAAGSVPLANGTNVRWLAMEYMPHGDVAAWTKRHGPPPIELGVRWFDQALQGLHYAHEQGILHRDIKPQNLLLASGGDVKLCDFGLLKEVKPDDLSLTAHGSVMGTPQYISPEQAMGEEADERSDLYSLGASFFHIFSGRLPFEETNTTAMLVRASRDQAPALLDVAPQTPRPLSVMIRRMMAGNREDRYQNVDVALDDLHSYLKRGLLKMNEESISLASPTVLRPFEATRVFTMSERESKVRPGI